MLAVAGKHLETGQLTKHTGTFLRLSTPLVIHSLAAVISPPASFPLLPAFWLCETYMLYGQTGNDCLLMLKVVRNGKWTARRWLNPPACVLPPPSCVECQALALFYAHWVTCIKIELWQISVDTQHKNASPPVTWSQISVLSFHTFISYLIHPCMENYSSRFDSS